MKKKLSRKQLKAIRTNYYFKSIKEKDVSKKVHPKPIKEKRKTKFKLPLKNGGHRWNIYRVNDKFLNGRNNGQTHGGLVLDENNNKVLLVEVTHSNRTHNRNNYPVRNININDLDNNGNLRPSYIVKKIIPSYKNKKDDSISGIDDSVLLDKINNSNYTHEEKIQIIEELSKLSTAEEKYNEFIYLSKKK